MSIFEPLLEFSPSGIYCRKADIYIDPWKPVNRAIITHGHSDHAKEGHNHYLTHRLNAPIIRHRLGKIHIEEHEWGDTFRINGVKFSLHPAGHIIGSSQVRIEYKGEVWVFTGDFKTEDDGLSTPFELVKCHTLITESTFGLPVFKWRPQSEVVRDINSWWRDNRNDGKISVLFSYTLGKAQRIIKYLDPSIGKIYTHGAVENMNEILRPYIKFPVTRRVTAETAKSEFEGGIIIAPPSAHGSGWMKKFTPYVTATASGWMAIRGNRRRRAVDRGFVVSDHADWDGLQSTIKNTGAERVICTHGYTDIMTRYLRDTGLEAYAETTEFEGESLDSDNSGNE